ncbi:MAG: transcription elongation factor GreB [Pseudomonadota bacterium]
MTEKQKNYITPRGFLKLQQEFSDLFYKERPKLVETVAWAASNGDRSENGDYIYGKRRLRQIDSRLRHLRNRIESAHVINPGQQPKDKVLFSAHVTYQDENGLEKTYQIVGEYEYDPTKNQISWKSPVAKALLGKQIDDEVVLRRPKGELEVCITNIEYIPQDDIEPFRLPEDMDLEKADSEE